ncbi:MAG: sensor histidine kinase [Chloroflexi bacterium]|nr:sensor histidine kinase [Chloroflexota bacterium]
MRTKPANKKRDARLFGIILLLMVAAFITDLRLPLGVAGGVPFVVPVALALWFLQPTYTWVVAGLSGALIVLDIFLKPSSGVPFYFVIINRSYAFLAIGILLGIGHLQKRLLRANERLAALSVMEERERLSRELHDDLLQSLGGLGARASAVSELLAQSRTEDARRELTTLRDSVEKAYLDVRHYVTGLRMSSLSDRRFLKALEDFARVFTRQSGLGLDFRVAEGTPQFWLSPVVETQAMRIVQEALTNITRHAQARKVSVRVSLNGPFLEIGVQDDGWGFDPDRVDGQDHLGLQIMRERAELAGGRLAVLAAPGSGTQVTVTVPYQKKEA